MLEYKKLLHALILYKNGPRSIITVTLFSLLHYKELVHLNDEIICI